MAAALPYLLLALAALICVGGIAAHEHAIARTRKDHP